MYLTSNDLANIRLMIGAGENDSKVIERLIKDWIGSTAYQEMVDGENYYIAKQDILDVNFQEYTNKLGSVVTDENHANNHLVHAAHRRMVIEKIAYLLNVDITITNDADKQLEIAKTTLGREFNSTVYDWATGASNKGVEWLHPYIDGSELAFMVMDAREIIPIYETSRQKKLESVIRFYTFTRVDETDGYMVEWYWPDRVDFYTQDESGNFSLTDQRGHFEFTDDNTGQVIGAGSWGIVPFIDLKNNPNKVTDLKAIKTLIDALDRSKSIFTNNLEDIQEVMLKVIGFGNEDPAAVRENARVHKVVCVEGGMDGANADVDKIEVSIPHEARKVETDDIIKAIYAYGMGMNPFMFEFGSDPSGVALKILAQPMVLKAGMLEKKLVLALYDVMWFVQQYLMLNGKGEIDPDAFRFTLNKTFISNEKEMAEIQQAMNGLVTEVTRLENNSWVDDPEVEAKALEDERNNAEKIDLGAFE